MLYDREDAYLYDDLVPDLDDDSHEACHLEPLRKDGKAILAPHWVSTEEWRRIQNLHWYDELSPATAELLNPGTSTSRVLPCRLLLGAVAVACYVDLVDGQVLRRENGQLRAWEDLTLLDASVRFGHEPAVEARLLQGYSYYSSSFVAEVKAGVTESWDIRGGRVVDIQNVARSMLDRLESTGPSWHISWWYPAKKAFPSSAYSMASPSSTKA